MTKTANQDITQNKEVVSISLLLFIVFLIFGLAVARAFLGFDYAPHISSAQEMFETRQITRTNFLYELLIIIFRVLIPFDSIVIYTGTRISAFSLAGLTVAVGFYVLLAGILYYYLYTVSSTRRDQIICASLAFALLIVAPINLFTLPIQNLYYGYIGLATYHNPTMVLLRPLALLLFIYVLTSVRANDSSLKSILIVAGLLIAATLSKPSFTICLLPLLAAWCVYRHWHKEPLPWHLLGWGIGIPALGLLAWQYYHRYIFDVFGVSMSIVFSPFSVMAAHSAQTGLATWTLLPKFFLSILFPLVTYICYLRRARFDVVLNLAWALFGIGATLSYFLAEFERLTGKINLAGDFLWGAQVSLFILFVISTKFFLEQLKDFLTTERPRLALDRRAILCATVFGLHLVSGVTWYVLAVFNNQDAGWL